MNYKTIQVTPKEYELLMKLYGYLMRWGTKSIEEVGEEFNVDETLKELEREAIERALNQVGGNRRRAAEFLGIGVRTLYRKLDEYGLK
ncbi:MAG: helix-turn-helix domain-containing protein [Candidatus Hydrothermarchaeota archaeon]|nr:helix-turn-helix domain-containing protein [Candidatus Hydrothermarchaeota archaeon]